MNTAIKPIKSIKSGPLNSPRSLCSALLFAAISMACVLPSTQAKDHQVPFRATFSTEGESVVMFPNVHLTIFGQGVALHMGATTLLTTDQVLNLITLQATGTYTLTAANGDTVVLGVEVDYVIFPEGVEFSGEYTVVGGTGRFAGATGGGTLNASATFGGPVTATGSLILEGTISSPGRN